jgi:hypothetical protein
MLSDVAMLDPVRVVVMLSPNQTVRMRADGTSEPALLQVDPGLTHSVQILFRSFEESASQIR